MNSPLESRCRASINTAGLEPSIGFLHEIAQPKYPLVYDLQEPFRWLVDTTVLSCVENKTFDRNDFLLTDNYVLRLKSSAIKKLLEELRSHLNSKVSYNGKYHSWDGILKLKTQELARYLLGRSKELDFRDPQADLGMSTRDELRERTLTLTLLEARKIEIEKSTLWYLKKRARSYRPLRLYRKVRNRVASSD